MMGRRGRAARSREGGSARGTPHATGGLAGGRLSAGFARARRPTSHEAEEFRYTRRGAAARGAQAHPAASRPPRARLERALTSWPASAPHARRRRGRGSLAGSRRWSFCRSSCVVGMSIRLRELIRNVRAQDPGGRARAIHKECAAIRTAFMRRARESSIKNAALHPHAWLPDALGADGVPEADRGLEVLREARRLPWPDDPPRREAGVLMLVENSLKNDLQSQNQYIAGLACCSIGNIRRRRFAATCRRRSRSSWGSNPFVAKKAALYSIRILRKCPELVAPTSTASARCSAAQPRGAADGAEADARDVPDRAADDRAAAPPHVHPHRRPQEPCPVGLRARARRARHRRPFLQVEILRMLRILGTSTRRRRTR